MCFVNELELYFSLKMYIMVFLVLCAEQQLHCLFGELFTSGYFYSLFYSEGRLIVFQRAWKVFRKFCPLCYKQVIALSPRRIKDKFHLYFESFHFENTRENLSLILLGLMRLHILNRD